MKQSNDTIKTFDTIYIHYKGSMKERLEMRKHCGPYMWSPSPAGQGRGFYSTSADMLVMGDGPIKLRMKLANDCLPSYSRLSRITGYYCDEHGDGDTVKPVVFTLPNQRGFLAGWSKGEGMCGSVAPGIYESEHEAALGAHALTENDAEREREYQARERAMEEEREHEEELRGMCGLDHVL